MMDDLTRKQSEAIARRIDALETPDGADAFIAHRRRVEQFYQNKLSPSLRQVCEKALDELRKRPEAVVVREIQALSRQREELEAKDDAAKR